MAIERIIAEWQKGVFKPVYWLEGEEEYFMTKLLIMPSITFCIKTKHLSILVYFTGVTRRGPTL
jgi:hypothetical protein